MDNEQIKRLEEDDKKYVWPPFTQMDEWIKGDPLIITAAKFAFWITSIFGSRLLSDSIARQASSTRLMHRRSICRKIHIISKVSESEVFSTCVLDDFRIEG